MSETTTWRMPENATPEVAVMVELHNSQIADLMATIRDREAEILRIQTHETAAAERDTQKGYADLLQAKFTQATRDTDAALARAERAEAAWKRLSEEVRQHRGPGYNARELLEAKAAVDAAKDLEEPQP